MTKTQNSTRKNGRCIRCQTTVWPNAPFGDGGHETTAGWIHDACQPRLVAVAPASPHRVKTCRQCHKPMTPNDRGKVCGWCL